MPSDLASAQQGQRYLRAWTAIGSLLQAGRSWSGRERNRVFLNTLADFCGVRPLFVTPGAPGGRWVPNPGGFVTPLVIPG